MHVVVVSLYVCVCVYVRLEATHMKLTVITNKTSYTASPFPYTSTYYQYYGLSNRALCKCLPSKTKVAL